MAKDRKQKQREKDEEQKRRITRFKGMIRKFDDPALSQVCTPVHQMDDLRWLRTLRQVCMATEIGVGLAAPQIGILQQAMYVAPRRLESRNNFDGQKYLLNLEILETSPETEFGVEGCLSYPGYSGLVERPTWIKARYLHVDIGEEYPNPHEVTAVFRDWECRVILHEYDHTKGICRVKDFWRAQQNPQSIEGFDDPQTAQPADQRLTV